jgi:hypothetical protein
MVFYHRCRPDGVRRRLKQVVELPPVFDDSDPEVNRFAGRADWFTSLYPTPPAPSNRKAPPR